MNAFSTGISLAARLSSAIEICFKRIAIDFFLFSMYYFLKSLEMDK